MRTWLLSVALAGAEGIGLNQQARAAPPGSSDSPIKPGPLETQPPLSAALDSQLEAINGRAAAIQDLTADFEQLKHTALLKRPLRSAGTLRVRGAAMRWDTREPQPGVMAMDGTTLKLYFPRQRLLEEYPLDSRLGELAASPLPRLEVVRQHFKIEEMTWQPRIEGAETAPEDEAHFLALRLTPIAAALREHVDEVWVRIDRRTGLAVASTIVYPDHERLELFFRNVRANIGLRAEDVALIVPAGTTISRPLEKPGGEPAPADRPNSQEKE